MNENLGFIEKLDNFFTVMEKGILYFHQLPQNLLGLLVIATTKAKKDNVYGCYVSEKKKSRFAMSFGNYIVFGGIRPTEEMISDRKKFQKVSVRLGWLYLPMMIIL